MPELKPWRSMEEQLNILQQRGLKVDHEAAALNYLSRIGYYRLSGYWYPLRAIDHAHTATQRRPVRSDNFVPDSHFEDVVQLYVFDKRLRLLALDALERIEMAIRVDVAYLLGAKDPCAHQNPECLHGNFAKRANRRGPHQGKTDHQLWLEKFETMVWRARKEPFIEHHSAKYQGHLPIWVAIEVWDFGLLSRLFAGMKYHDKNQIANKYGLASGDVLARWLRSLNFIRNVAAHHSRLWNINVLERSPLPQEWLGLDNAKPFMYFCIMQKMMAVICPNSSWGKRLMELLEDFPETNNGALVLDDLGLNSHWRELWLSLCQK
ncbi:Abi family protein [Alkalimonas sp.]|uniref:Abi family protein n=1 Tax=Alkalimonas sp. TaxID=1872453 RepID=UPI00263AA517|nr:Abi family protein [Alkalimonas sp.]MCC5825626.1 Abi family protein [Alkalimonas sp.]